MQLVNGENGKKKNKFVAQLMEIGDVMPEPNYEMHEIRTNSHVLYLFSHKMQSNVCSALK